MSTVANFFFVLKKVNKSDICPYIGTKTDIWSIYDKGEIYMSCCQGRTLFHHDNRCVCNQRAEKENHECEMEYEPGRDRSYSGKYWICAAVGLTGLFGVIRVSLCLRQLAVGN